jgi:NAD(P)-dependent dehydrogenase (short-subunit alcohol dehydrogenase family)
VDQAGSGAGHPKSSATDGYGDQEQLERAEKGQGWAQPWITKAHLVKSQMLNDLKSEQVLRVLLTCGRARSLVLMCGIGTIEVKALRCARFDSRSSLVVQLKSSALIFKERGKMSTTWFITGASRGIGRELTEQALARVDCVAATLRHPEQLDDLAAVHGDRLWVRQLDVTDTMQLGRVVEEAFTDHERIDVVVSNAGFGVFGAAEDLTNDQVEQMIATNLTAAIHLARLVVPYLRRQGGGRLMQLSSMGGHIAFPAFSLYHATKWGIEGFYEALAQEVEPFGIHTTLVEPGMIRTSFYEAATRVPVSEPYQGGPADRKPIPLEQMPGSQTRVVAAMIEAALSENPPRRLLLGSDAYGLVTHALNERLATFERQRAVAFSTDVDQGEVAS